MNELTDKKIIDKIEGIDIDSIEMSGRLYNCLKRAGYNTLTDIMIENPDNFSKLQHFGAKTVSEILELRKFIKNSSREDILHECSNRNFKNASVPNTSLQESKNTMNSNPSSIENRFDTVAELIVSKSVSEEKIGFIHNGQYYDDIEISSIQFSIRTRNILLRNGLLSLKMISMSPVQNLCSIRGCGKKVRDEIFEVIKDKLIIKECNEINDRIYEEIISEIYDFYSKIINREILEENRKEIEYALFRYCSNGCVKTFDEINKYELSEMEPFNRLIRQTIVNNLSECLYYGIDKLELIQRVTNNDTDSCEIVDAMVSKMLEEKQIRADSGKLYRYRQFLIEWIDSLSVKYSEALRSRCSGLTLEETGSILGVTRERVRQIISKAFRIKPDLYEDEYRRFVMKYSFSRKEFCAILGLEDIQINYLLLKYGRGNKHLQSFLDDNDIPEVFKERARNIFSGKIIFLDGECLQLKRDILLRKVLRDNFSNHESSIEQFAESYMEFLHENGIDCYEELQFPNRRALEARISNVTYTIEKLGKRIRYYDTLSIDINRLLSEVSINQYNNMEISTLKIFRDYPEVMDRYDIRDEYELHNLFRKRSADIKICNMFITRMPLITIGQGDRKRQVRNLLLKMAPVENTVLAEAYETTYGVKAETVLANFFKPIDEYYHDGLFDIEQQDLTISEYSILKKLLTDEIYLWDTIVEIYSKNVSNPTPNAINSMTLKRLGFKVYSQYVVRSRCQSAEEFFRVYLLKNEVLNLESLPKGVKNISSCYGVLNQLRDELELIEIDKDIYYRIEEFILHYSTGTKTKLLEIGAMILDQHRSEYLSATCIAKEYENGESNMMLANPYIINSILRAQPGIKSTKIFGTYIACGIQRDLSLSAIIISIIKEVKSISVSKLSELLKKYYEIHVYESRLINIICGSDVLVYDDCNREIRFCESDFVEDIVDITYLKDIKSMYEKSDLIKNTNTLIAKVYWKDKFSKFVEYCGLKGCYLMNELLDLNLKEFYCESFNYSLTRNTILEIINTYIEWVNSTERQSTTLRGTIENDTEINEIMKLFFKKAER